MIYLTNILFILILLIIEIVNGVPCLTSYSTNGYYEDWYHPIRLDNWMAQIPGSRLIKDISIPGTHDSGSSGVKSPFISHARCQSMIISRQLESGIRYIDVRIKEKSGVYKIYHGSNSVLSADCYLSLTDVLTMIKAFLKSNPSEVIIMRLRAEDKKDSTYTGGKSFIELWFQQNSVKFDVDYNQLWRKTLSSVRNSVQLVNLDDGGDCAVTGIYKQTREPKTIIDKKNDVIDFYNSYNRGDCSQGMLFNTLACWYANSYIFGSETNFALNVCGARYHGENIVCPNEYAKTMNSFFLTYTYDKYGVTIMDFPDCSIIKKIINANGLGL